MLMLQATCTSSAGIVVFTLGLGLELSIKPEHSQLLVNIARLSRTTTTHDEHIKINTAFKKIIICKYNYTSS